MDAHDCSKELIEACSPIAISRAISEGIVFQYTPRCSITTTGIAVADKNNYNGKVVAVYPVEELLTNDKILSICEKFCHSTSF